MGKIFKFPKKQTKYLSVPKHPSSQKFQVEKFQSWDFPKFLVFYKFENGYIYRFLAKLTSVNLFDKSEFGKWWLKCDIGQ